MRKLSEYIGVYRSITESDNLKFHAVIVTSENSRRNSFGYKKKIYFLSNWSKNRALAWKISLKKYFFSGIFHANAFALLHWPRSTFSSCSRNCSFLHSLMSLSCPAFSSSSESWGKKSTKWM